MKQKDELKTQTQADIADFLSQCVVGPVKQELTHVARQDALDRIEKTTKEGSDSISAGFNRISSKIDKLSDKLPESMSDAVDDISNKIDDRVPEIVDEAAKKLMDRIEELGNQLPNIHSKLETIIKGETTHLDTRFEQSEADANRVHKTLERLEQEQSNAVREVHQTVQQEADAVRQRLDGVSGLLQENLAALNGLCDEPKAQLDKMMVFNEKYRTLLIASLSIGTINLIGIAALVLMHLT